MTKFTSLLSSLIIACAMPMMAQEATSFYGTAAQNNGGATQGSVNYIPTNLGISWDLSNVYSASFGVGGSQEGSIGFSSSMTTQGDESGNGSGNTAGTTTVQGGLIQGTNNVGSWAYGNTSGNGSVSLTNTPCGSDGFWLSGSGSLTTGTSALIGNFITVAGSGGSVNLEPINGAFASSSTTGGFNFSVSGTSSNTGTNGTWSGNGYTTQTGYSQVYNLGNGYSATSSASVVSAACPVVK